MYLELLLPNGHTEHCNNVQSVTVHTKNGDKTYTQANELMFTYDYPINITIHQENTESIIYRSVQLRHARD